MTLHLIVQYTYTTHANILLLARAKWTYSVSRLSLTQFALESVSSPAEDEALAKAAIFCTKYSISGLSCAGLEGLGTELLVVHGFDCKFRPFKNSCERGGWIPSWYEDECGPLLKLDRIASCSSCSAYFGLCWIMLSDSHSGLLPVH